MNDNTTFHVGLTQWRPTKNLESNLQIALRMIAETAKQGADLVLLPENGLFLGSNKEMREAALSLDSPAIDALRAASAQAGVVTVVGGFKCRMPEEITNKALVIGTDGSMVGAYDKIHLFDARVGGRSFDASSVEKSGQCPAILEVKGVKVGLTVCYDVRFPELYRRLAVAGAQVMVVPSAFTQVTGEAHWEVLLRARAIESGAYVIASATIRGEDGADAFPTYGHALAVDPWGKVLVDLGETRAGCTVVPIELEKVEEARTSLPVLKGLQPEAVARDPVLLRA
jgi:predicted amidohydrolase